MGVSWEDFRLVPPMAAKMVLDACGIQQPPVCERTVAGYLGLEIVEATRDDFADYAESRGHERTPAEGAEKLEACLCWAHNGDHCILVNQSRPEARLRWSIFHEIGHFLGGHTRAVDTDSTPDVRKRRDRTANKYAAELIMPRGMFLKDVQALDIGLSAVYSLEERYVSSMEATASRYAELHPDPVAIVWARPGRDTGANTLCVEYAIESRRFPARINRDTEVDLWTYVEWDSLPGGGFGTIPSSALHLSMDQVLNVQCIAPHGGYRFLLLLWPAEGGDE